MNTRSSRIPYSFPTLVGVACVLLIMATPFISACDSGGSNGEGSSKALVPMEKGNRWEADWSDDGSSGTASLEMTSEDEADLQLTVQNATVRGTLEMSTSSNGGIVMESVSGAGEETDVMRFKYPAEEGDTYQHTDGDGSSFEVSVSRASVSVPAGDYDNCLQYEIRDAADGDIESTVTIKPGVGPVLWEEGSGAASYELVSTNVDG